MGAGRWGCLGKGVRVSRAHFASRLQRANAKAIIGQGIAMATAELGRRGLFCPPCGGMNLGERIHSE